MFFSCCVALERILTTDNLRRRGLIVVEWCFVCILFVGCFLGDGVVEEVWQAVPLCL